MANNIATKGMEIDMKKGIVPDMRRLVVTEIPEKVFPQYRQLFTPEFRRELVNQLLEWYSKATRIDYLEKWRINIRKGLKNDRWVIENHRAFSGIRILRETLHKSGNSAQAIESVGEVLSKIQRADPVLYRMIIGKGINSTEAGLLQELNSVAREKNVIRLIEHLEAYSGFYLKRAELWHDKRLSDEIKAWLVHVEGLKRSNVYNKFIYLNKVRSEFIKWNGGPRYFEECIRLTQQLINEIKVGYKDESLATEIGNSSEVKHLLRYKEEINYFQDLLAQVIEGEKQPDWAAFLEGFYKNLRSEEEHILYFGDIENAKRMQDVKDKYGQYPRAWMNMLNQVIEELKNPEKIKAVIITARDKILAIVVAKIEGILGKLRKDLRKPLGKINAVTNAKIRDIKNAKDVYLTIAYKREKIFRKGLKKVRAEFKSIEREELIPVMEEVLPLVKNIPTMLREPMQKLTRLDFAMHQQGDYAKRQISSVRESNPIRSIPYLAYVSVALNNLDDLEMQTSMIEEGSLKNVSLLFSNLPKINEAYTRIIGLLERLLRFVLSQGFNFNIKGINMEVE